MKSENHWRCRECRTEFRKGDVEVSRYCSRVPPGPGDFGQCPVCGIQKQFDYIGPTYVPPADAPQSTGLVAKRIEPPGGATDNEQVKPMPLPQDLLFFQNPDRKATMIRPDEPYRSTIVWTRDQLRELADVDCPICLGGGVVEGAKPRPCNCIQEGEEEC